MDCPSCAAPAPEGAKFCANCGAQLSVEAGPDIPIVEPRRDLALAPEPEADGWKTVTPPTPPPRTGSVGGAPAAGGKDLAKFACGCFAIPVVAIVLLIGGCSIWWKMQPKNVGYDDVLTTANASTFADHNDIWNNDDSNNTAYVQRAMQHLGDKAYGRKFGDLMDWEKAYEEKQEAQKQAAAQAAYYKAHPTPTPEPAWKVKEDALASARACNKSLNNLMDRVIQDGRSIAASSDVVDAYSTLRDMKSLADQGMVQVDSVACPSEFSKAADDTRVYLYNASNLADKAMKAVKDNDIDAAADVKELDNQLTSIMYTYASDSFTDYSSMGGNIKDLTTNQ